MLRTLLLSALVALGAPAAQATTEAEVLSAGVLPGWRTDSGTHMAALRLTLAPEWKTYWRAPGEAGIPPEFDWSGSSNLRSVRIHWPRPHVFHLNGMQTIGYRQELVLPIEITAIDPSQPIRLRATVDLGVCRDICMPASLAFAADLPAPGAPDSAIDKALRQRPDSGAQAGLRQIACDVEPIADGLRVTARMELPATGGDEAVVLEPGDGSIWVSEATVSRDGGWLTATADMVAAQGTPFVLDRSAVTVTVLGADRAVEIAGCPAP